MKTTPKNQAEWQAAAERVLAGLVRKVRATTLPREMLKGLPPKPRWQVGVRIISALEMRTLNRKYRRKNYATDVLSFEAPEIFKTQGMLGELVICLPTMKAQAKEQGIEPGDELRILVTHGVLHLLGFDHEQSERQARQMELFEKKLLPSRISRSGLIKRVASGNS